MDTITIDREFKTLIPPLTEMEFAQLRQSILAEGVRDALVIWNGILLDGHNRYEIAQDYGLPFRTLEIDLPDRDAAFNWIIDNQLGRRNLTPDQASYLRGKRYEREERQDGGHGDQKSEYQNDTPIPDTAARIAAQTGVSAPTIKRDAQFARAVDALVPQVPDIVERVMAGDIPTRGAVIEAARNPEKAVEILGRKNVHVANNSGNNEWYTPPEYIAAAREVMGGIDLDPASSSIANRTVGATEYYTAEQDGLGQEWRGRVWMNPPYASDLVGRFADKLNAHYLNGDIEQAIVLVNNATETAWFQGMLQLAAAVCFPRGRVKFIDVNGMPSGAPLQGQALLYFGTNANLFSDVFSRFGKVLHAR